MTVNQKIRVIRKEKKITTTRLAELIGVSQSSIVRYENGSVRYVPLELLEKMAAVFGCKTSDLTDGDDRYSQSGHNISSLNSFSPEEKDIIMKYRSLPSSLQKIIKEICNLHISIQ